jgi:phosphate transport system permease protein
MAASPALQPSSNNPAPRSGAGSVRSPAKGATDLGDQVFHNLCRTVGLVVILIFILILGVLFWQGLPAIRAHGFSFLIGNRWAPTSGLFGALPFVFGTLATSAIAILIAVPLGVGTAAFLSEIAPAWLRKTGAFLVEMLAAVPSVVYGMWGLFVLAPLVKEWFDRLGAPPTTGTGILTASLILSVMIVPYIAAVSFDVCQAVPRSQREGSLALGATRWQTIWSVVLPYARSGILGACFLALGRALGETMAVTLLIGGREQIQWSLFAQGDSIASRLATELNQASPGLWRSTLIELALVLVVVTIVVNALARLLILRARAGKSGSRWPGWLFGKSPVRPAPLPPSSPVTEKPTSIRPQRVNTLMTGVLGGTLAITLGPLFLILGYLVFQGVGSLNWDFFTNLPKPAGEPGSGLAHALVGSAILVSLATVGAVPLGILAAIYLAEYRASRMTPAVRFVGELINGVPSIIIGTVVYALMVIPMGHNSGWAGAVALGIMMIPIVMRTGEESLKLVPSSLRNASYALGASQWQTIGRVILPAALPAIITGVFLAVARIAGETAPLLLTASTSDYMPRSPNDSMPSLPMSIYNFTISPGEEEHRMAWAAALVLLCLVMLLSAGIRLLTGKRVVLASRAD